MIQANPPHASLLGNPTSSLMDPVSYRTEECDEMVAMVRELIDGSHPGILATIDENGNPRLRWMASLSGDRFPYLYTLTSPCSRKVADLQNNPRVNWMFFNQDMSLVVNMTGQADVLDDGKSIKEAWNCVRDKKSASFLKNCTEGPGCVVIRTWIERVECSVPDDSLNFDLHPEDIFPRVRHGEPPPERRNGPASFGLPIASRPCQE